MSQEYQEHFARDYQEYLKSFVTGQSEIPGEPEVPIFLGIRETFVIGLSDVFGVSGESGAFVVRQPGIPEIFLLQGIQKFLVNRKFSVSQEY